MKNITVSVDDELYHRARILAAQRQTSVSALVKGFLAGLEEEESEFDRLKRMEQQVRASLKDRGIIFRAADRLTRDDLHTRDAFR